MKRLLTGLLLTALAFNAVAQHVLPHRRAHFRSAATFNPSDYGYTVVHWAKSASLSTGALSSWTDLSGSGNTLEQATAGNQPTVATDGSGRNYVGFDGSSDFMATAGDVPAMEGLGGFTAIVVGSIDGTSVGPPSFYNKHFSATDGTWGMGFLGSSTAFRFLMVNSGSTRVNVDPATTFTATTVYIVMCIYDGSNMYVRVNGNLITASAAHTGVTKDTTYPLTVGQYSGGPLNGKLYEVAFIADNLDTTQQDDAFTKLGTQYGITITP